MNVKEIVKWLKAHKKELAIIAGTLVIGCVAFAIVRNGTATKFIKIWSQGFAQNPPIPEMGIGGEIKQLWNESANGKPVVTAIVNNVAVADLGRFGEVLTKIEGVSADAMTDIIISVAKNG